MNNNSINIRKGNKDDLPRVLELIRELALFEKAPDEVENTVKDMEEDGFGQDAAYKLLVAEMDNKIVGIAVYFIKYSTWKGKGIYLDDLLVTEEYRGKGIGKKLFDEVIDEAKKINAKQMHWQVLDWNTPAIDFYKKYGASIDAEWLDCKLHFSK
jgi:GNAT superfamily N-acetyltransferase